MIVTVVRLNGSGPLTVDQARGLFSENAAGYLDVKGLISKTYIVSHATRDAGAVYLWSDRESAEAKFNDGWHEGVKAKYGAAPVVEYFDAPMHLDVVRQVVRVEAPPQIAIDR